MAVPYRAHLYGDKGKVLILLMQVLYNLWQLEKNQELQEGLKALDQGQFSLPPIILPTKLSKKPLVVNTYTDLAPFN